MAENLVYVTQETFDKMLKGIESIKVCGKTFYFKSNSRSP